MMIWTARMAKFGLNLIFQVFLDMFDANYPGYVSSELYKLDLLEFLRKLNLFPAFPPNYVGFRWEEEMV